MAFYSSNPSYIHPIKLSDVNAYHTSKSDYIELGFVVVVVVVVVICSSLLRPLYSYFHQWPTSESRWRHNQLLANGLSSLESLYTASLSA